MIRIFSHVRAALLVAIMTTFGIAALADDQANPQTRDLLILTNWFEGQFDNEEQVWFQADPRSATPEADRHERIHVVHHRIDAPTFGEHVFYVEEYQDNESRNIVRQRLVTFASDLAAGAIRMRQGFFRDAASLAGAHREPERSAGLREKDVFFVDGCDVLWQRKAGQFEGGMLPKACVFGKDELRRYSVHNLTLSKDQYWRVDTTFLVSDDSLHIGHPVDRPFRLRRARDYVCAVIFIAPDGERQTVSDLVMHSQGGTVDVERASDGEKFTVLMRDKEYPYYGQRPDFMYFSVRREGEQRSIGYSVHDVRSRTLGIKVDELIAHCYLKGYEFRETYDQIIDPH